MDDAIVTRQMMQQKGADAFRRGISRDDHGMNPWALGISDWCKGFDRAATVNQYAAMAQQGLDVAQVES